MKRSRESVKKQRSAWASGVETTVPKKRIYFENYVAKLGLDPENLEALAASPAIKAWCSRHRNTHFIPSLLLHKLGLDNAWLSHAENKAERNLPRISMYDVGLACAKPPQ
jgi:hypothetical protein